MDAATAGPSPRRSQQTPYLPLPLRFDQLVDVAELTEHYGLNHKAIRQHLAKLADAGLILSLK
jgi:DNA-binding transcriptional ArsR family regulator